VVCGPHKGLEGGGKESYSLQQCQGRARQRIEGLLSLPSAENSWRCMSGVFPHKVRDHQSINQYLTYLWFSAGICYVWVGLEMECSCLAWLGLVRREMGKEKGTRAIWIGNGARWWWEKVYNLPLYIKLALLLDETARRCGEGREGRVFIHERWD